MKFFEPFTVNQMTVKNRLVMPPMCMYSCFAGDGRVTDFHLAHYASRAIGQVGLIIVEATGVTPEGRISDQCLGLWEDAQVEGMRKLVDSVHAQGSKIALQLNHAGRKSTTAAPGHLAPSAIAYNNHEINYAQMTQEDITRVVDGFRLAAQRADAAGYDGLELHGAHGYLIHQFLSPLSNQRADLYGQDRLMFLREVVQAVRTVWPKEKPLWIRISATDWLEGGITAEDWIGWLDCLRGDLDMVHVSSGGLQKANVNVYPGYMLPLARQVGLGAGLPAIGVGYLDEDQLILHALESGACDLVALGRELLRNPNKFNDLAVRYGRPELVAKQYERAYKDRM